MKVPEEFVGYSKGYRAAAEKAHQKTGVVLATVNEADGLSSDHMGILSAIDDARVELAKIEQWLIARLADS